MSETLHSAWVMLAAAALVLLNAWALHATVARLARGTVRPWLVLVAGPPRLLILAGLLLLLAGDRWNLWVCVLVGLVLARGVSLWLIGSGRPRGRPVGA
ncbi:MAG: hypothetical protein IT450_12890 [Phycisphaerales bacterium]|nr:hypothetical protein [Phycisphaerales bacterium]